MTAKKTPIPPCIHHYLITPPDGPTSGGACAKCGKTRTFTNMPHAMWASKPWELR